MKKKYVKFIDNGGFVLFPVSGLLVIGAVAIGAQILMPNKRGVFKIKTSWFIYENDKRNVKSISGPFADKDILFACAKMLHKSKYFEKYRFSNEAKKLYIHSHYRNVKDVELLQ